MPFPSPNNAPEFPKNQAENRESALTASVSNKLIQLSILKHRQLLEQQSTVKRLPQQLNDSAETAVQSFDQPAELEGSASPTCQNIKPTATTRYTISGRMPNVAESMHSPQAPDASEVGRNELLTKDRRSQRGPDPSVVFMDFQSHSGEAVITRPPVIGDDLQSRLNSLRQFKDWTQRIHGGPQEQTLLATNVVHRHSTKSANDIHVVEEHSSTMSDNKETQKRDQDGHLCTECRIVERVFHAPTPFCSPQVTPVSFSTAKEGVREYSTSPTSLDLRNTSSQDAVVHTRPRSQSRTVVISSETPNVQIAPVSGASLQKTSATQELQRANSKPKSHPPISFPSDFYERFPREAPSSTSSRTQQFRPAPNITPGVSPKTTTANSSTINAVSEDIEPLFSTYDERDRPEFYTTIHYFTECPHSSPPENRPLDAKGQPRQDPSFQSTKGQSTRSIIPGACFSCDLVGRREQEDTIINTYMTRFVVLADELAEVLDEIELGESDDEETASFHDRHSARLLTTSRFAEDKHDLDLDMDGSTELPPLSDDADITIAPQSGKIQTGEQRDRLDTLILRIRELEMQIEILREDQEKQIKKIWSGFTPRWGPGTLGVQYRNRAIDTSRDAREGFGHTQEQAHDDLYTAAAGVDALQGIHLAAGIQGGSHRGTDNDGSSSVGRDRSQTRSESSRSRSRSRNGTPTTTASSVASHRDPPGSRTPGEGKMKIGWIREEKS